MPDLDQIDIDKLYHLRKNMPENFVWCEAAFINDNKLEFVQDGQKYQCWHLYNSGIKEDEPKTGDTISLLIEKCHSLINYQGEVYGHYFKIREVQSLNPHFCLHCWGFEASFVSYIDLLRVRTVKIAVAAGGGEF